MKHDTTTTTAATPSAQAGNYARTFAHLEALAASKRVVCERTGKRIELTTPDGSVTAECSTVAEALDTLASDPTFADLPTVNPHQNPDGSFWEHGPAGLFADFGATLVYPVPPSAPGMQGCGPTFMIKLKDGLWHYAHDSRSSHYAAAEGYDAPSGEIAWLYNVQHVRARAVENARAALGNAEYDFRETQNALAAALDHKRMVDAQLAARLDFAALNR